MTAKMKIQRIQLFLCLVLVTWGSILGSDADRNGPQLSSVLSAMSPHKDVSQSQPMLSGHRQSDGEFPTFLLEPQDTYFVVKNKPVVLTCRASHAKNILFKCGGQWVDLNALMKKEGMTPETGLKYLEVSIEVTKEKVDDHSSGADGYHCECYAMGHNMPLPVGSRTGVIHSAYLKKRFEREPLSSTVQLGSAVELTCSPPLGQPSPEVFWLKNGEELDVSADRNLIISNDGSLIINQATLDDQGNYTCGAQNMASRRLTESAFLTVYVNGGWSSWSSWSECGSKCTKRRSRTCTNPTPFNGGTPCDGEAFQKVQCPHGCPEIPVDRFNADDDDDDDDDDEHADGGWSAWSQWSQCGTDCRQHRKRLCDSPMPGEGGKYCPGKDVEVGNCTRGSCRGSQLLVSQPMSDDESFQDATLSSATQSDNTAMFVGLTLAVILFALCLVVAILVVRCRKRTPPSPQTKLVSQVQDIYMPPDVTRSLIGHQQQQQQQQHQHLAYQQEQQRHQIQRSNIPTSGYPGYPTGAAMTSYQDGDSCMESPYCHLNFPQDPSDDESDPRQQQCFQQPQQHREVSTAYYQHQSSTAPGFHGPGFNPHFGQSHPGSSASSSSSSSTQRPRSGQGVGSASQHPSTSNSSTGKSKYSNNNINNQMPYQHQRAGMTTNPHIYASYPPMVNHPMESSPEPIRHRFPTGAGAVVWGSFGPHGGKISLDESDISLTVLSGSVEHNLAQDMFLAVSRDDKDRPKLSDTQTILSPVVLCGPKSANLSKPIIVSFQHCACLKPSQQWVMSLYFSDAPYDVPPKWELLCTVGSMPQENHPQACVHVDSNRCHVMTDRPIAMLALVGEPSPTGRACKILRMAAFAPPLTSLMTSPVDWSIRVYIIEDTFDALEGVLQVEQGLGGCLLDKPKSMLFQYGGSNLCLSVHDVAPGWRNKMDVDCQEIPFNHIWSGGRNGLHCSVTLERISDSANPLTCDVHIFQKNLLENLQVLQINCDSVVEQSCVESPTLKGPAATTSKSVINGMNPAIETERIPGTVRRRLCELLDESNPRGNNWKLLAQTLNLERYMDYFSAKVSPTDILLSLWQAKHPEPSAVPDLITSLRLIGRQDAAEIMARSLDPVHL